MGRVVIAVYKPRPGKERELAALIEGHVPRLRAAGLVTDRTPIAAADADGTIIEVFEWLSEDAIASAHSHPARNTRERSRPAADVRSLDPLNR